MQILQHSMYKPKSVLHSILLHLLFSTAAIITWAKLAYFKLFMCILIEEYVYMMQQERVESSTKKLQIDLY